MPSTLPGVGLNLHSGLVVGRSILIYRTSGRVLQVFAL